MSQEDKLNAEKERQIRLAEEKKQAVREKIDEIRRQFGDFYYVYTHLYRRVCRRRPRSWAGGCLVVG